VKNEKEEELRLNCSFHHGPFSPCNKIKYQALVFWLDKATTYLLFKDTGGQMTICFCA